MLDCCTEKMGLSDTPLPSSQQPQQGKEGAKEKINCSYSAVRLGPRMEGSCSSGGSYSKQQNNCRMTFWHSFVGMIHYDDVSVQDNTEEITGHDQTAQCCDTVIG